MVEQQRLAYRRTSRFGDIWVQLNPATQRWRWRIPTRAPFQNWSTSHYGTHEDAFYNAEMAVQRSPSLMYDAVSGDAS